MKRVHGLQCCASLNRSFGEDLIVNVCFHNVSICWVVFELWSRGLGCGSSTQQASGGGELEC